jgi:hypothetical protein
MFLNFRVRVRARARAPCAPARARARARVFWNYVPVDQKEFNLSNPRMAQTNRKKTASAVLSGSPRQVDCNS